jgi:hypothetical protein
MSVHVYEVCLRKDTRGVDLISDVLPFGRLWYDGPNVRGAATRRMTAPSVCPPRPSVGSVSDRPQRGLAQYM